jgi:glycosyltransferase involved in cell wall biosynthesis
MAFVGNRIPDMPTPETFPRVLFITPLAFNKVTGTGITFTNLFKGWPKDRIATVHDDTITVTTDVCDTYYRLNSAEIRKFGGSITNQAGAHASTEMASNPQLSFRMNVLQTVKKWVFGDGLPQRGILTPELEAWIENFKPDVIYTILGSNGLMDIVEHVQQRFGVPLVVHIMDDWMSGSFKSGLLGPLQRMRMQRSIRRLIEKSSLRLSICDAMSDVYSERFGVPFEAFQNVVNTEAVAPYITGPKVLGTSVKIVYAGSVFAYAQQQSLIDCCQAIAQLAIEGASVQLDIHCPPSHIAGMEGQFVTGPAIKLHGPLTDDDDFFSTICNADILLIPANFDQKSIDFIRYSMPTRVPAYLASGTPILVYGPSDVAQVQYAEKAGWGMVVNKRDAQTLVKALDQLCKNENPRHGLVQTARKLVHLHHDATLVRQNFRNVISGLCETPPENARENLCADGYNNNG